MMVSCLVNEKMKAVELHCDLCSEEQAVGDIYIGKAETILPGLRAAFIKIAPDLNAYLPLEELKNPVYTQKGQSQHLQQGDELLVQLRRTAWKTKAPAVSAALTLQGTYAVVDTGNTENGVSRKIPEQRRNQLRELAGKAGDEGMGIVIRTNAAEAPDDVIEREIAVLTQKMKSICERAKYRTCYSKVYASSPGWLVRLKNLRLSQLEEIVTADQELAEQIREYLKDNNPQALPLLRLYDDPLLPLEKLYRISEIRREASSERVWLSSGAFLVIQPTEAMTVIDVNSGKSQDGKKRREKEEVTLKVNLEATEEIARQMRLRSLSGIIMVDFINMETEESKEKLLRAMNDFLSRDPVPAQAVDITKLGLMEITRKKVDKPLES